MPLGDGFGQLIRPSGVTPIASAPTVVRDTLGDILTGLASEVQERVKPIVVDRAIQQGRADGEAGIQGEGNLYTDIGVAYQRANDQAYLARNDIDRDEALAALELQHAANPQAFQEAAITAKAEKIKAARGSLAVSIEQSWDRAIGRRFAKIQTEQVRLGLKNAKDDIDRRLVQMSDTLQAAARNGTLSSDAAVEAMETYNRLVDEKAANPLWGYSQVDATGDRARLAASVAGLTAGRHANELFDRELAAGKDANRAHADARQSLLTAFETDPALVGLGETARVAMMNAADNALSENLRVKKELALSEANILREEARERATRFRDNRESLERRLFANPSAVSPADIQAMVDRGDLDQGDANGLLRYRRAEGDRIAAEQRRAEAQVAAAQRTAQAAERSAQAATRQAQSAARSAAADERAAAAAQRTAFNQGSASTRETIQSTAIQDPDTAYANFQRRQGVMSPADRTALRAAIMTSYRERDTNIKGALQDSAPSDAVGRDLARRYDAWTLANPYATVDQRRLKARELLSAPTSTGLRQGARSAPPAMTSRPPPIRRTTTPQQGRPQ